MTSEATRHVMQANKSKNTTPELTMRAALREAGLTGYRLHWKKAPGHPDICFPGRKVAIFVNEGQVEGSTSGGGYRLLGPASPTLRGNGCCCTYLPCVLRNLQ